MKDLPRISDAELEVMKIVWNCAPISTTEVIERLTATTKWSPKTIQTMLLRLVKKGALSYEKSSRVFVYSPAVAREDYVNRESESFLHRFYGGTLRSMVVNFLEEERLSQDEIEELRQLLEQNQARSRKYDNDSGENQG
ncbi:BlaI/MecI/CopY family transcriptional regulator [Lachnospiraceae bacterium ASD3451]|uniref:BlaI/MecI/CopY family transcriptional regulator n=1 Tax=Diplocloster agilis TaxID=2850323 RepID=UPI001DD642D6|nr:BlaI/MecI/CopY family transcriptional regulator [Diplocloster agilis]MBU9742983.1 BlaI/MecI/CopY family transcriptional regulator [Diplocloster agilis]